MKANKLLGTQNRRVCAIALIAIIALALIVLPLAGCGGDDDPPSPETFTVKFDANGGNPTPPDQTVEKGKTVSEPTGVTKANNTLDGWYKESALTTKWIFADGNGVAADTVTASITLFAKWIETKIGSISFIPIYKTDGISDEEAATAVDNMKKAFFTKMSNEIQDVFYSGVKKIYLLEGNSKDLYSFDKATGILNVGSGWTLDNYVDCFENDVYPTLQGKQKPDDTSKTVTFDQAYSVTIISDDKFTAAEWTTLCANVVTALETAYNAQGALNKGKFGTVFSRDCGVCIILEKNPTDYINYKVGVVGDDFKELYLNVEKIETVKYEDAISAMNGKNSSDPLMKD